MKTACISVDGFVTKVLPNAFYRVTLEQRDTEVLAYLGGKLGKRHIKPDVGDKVTLEMSPTDITKGRIIKRF